MKNSVQNILKRILCIALFWGTVKIIASIETWDDWRSIIIGFALSFLLITELLAGYEDAEESNQ